MNRTVMTVGALGALALVACGDPDPHPGAETGSGLIALELRATSSASPDALLSREASGRSLFIRRASAHIAHVELKLPGRNLCDTFKPTDGLDTICSDSLLRIRGPFIMNLITGTSTPSLAQVPIPQGTYKSVNIMLTKGDDDSDLINPGDPLDGNAMHIEGDVEMALGFSSFDLSLSQTLSIPFEGPEGVKVGRVAESAIMEWDVAAWFEDIPIGQCTADGNIPTNAGRASLSSGRGPCANVAAKVAQRARTSGRLTRRD